MMLCSSFSASNTRGVTGTFVLLPIAPPPPGAHAAPRAPRLPARTLTRAPARTSQRPLGFPCTQNRRHLLLLPPHFRPIMEITINGHQWRGDDQWFLPSAPLPLPPYKNRSRPCSSPFPARALSLPPRVLFLARASPEPPPSVELAGSSTPRPQPRPSPAVETSFFAPCSPSPPCTRARAQGRRKSFCVLSLQISEKYSCIFCSTSVCKRSPKIFRAPPPEYTCNLESIPAILF
jgi:hypothetical protein